MHPRTPLVFLATRTHCWSWLTCCPPGHPGPSSQSCSLSGPPWACTGAWGCSFPGAGPCTCPFWTSSGSSAPNSPACAGLAGWHHSLLVYPLLLPILFHQQTRWGYTLSLQLWHKWPCCPGPLLYEVLAGTISSRLSPAPAISSSFLQHFRLGWWQLSGAQPSSPPFAAVFALLITWLVQAFYSKLGQGGVTGHCHRFACRPAGALCVQRLLLHCHTVIKLRSHHLLCVFNQFSPKERSDMVLIWSLVLDFQLTLLKKLLISGQTQFSLSFSASDSGAVEVMHLCLSSF